MTGRPPPADGFCAEATTKELSSKYQAGVFAARQGAGTLKASLQELIQQSWNI